MKTSLQLFKHAYALGSGIKVLVLFLLITCTAITASAQVPQKISYQAIIRNSSDEPVSAQAVGMKISILQGSASGTAAYVETQTPTTSANGLAGIEIGGGTVVSGTFATINWANGPYFIKTETDPAGGTNYTITGTSQLLSVPYAITAGTSNLLKGGSSPTFASIFGFTNSSLVTWNPNGAMVATRFFYNVNIGGSSTVLNNYRFSQARAKYYRIGASDMRSVNPAIYGARIDHYDNPTDVNGLGSMWAAGGTIGSPAYFAMPVHLPDSALIIGLTANFIRLNTSLPAVLELYRTNDMGTSTLLCSATSTNGGANTVYSEAVSTEYRAVDNQYYSYFIRYSGDQNNINVRFVSAWLTYTINRVD